LGISRSNFLINFVDVLLFVVPVERLGLNPRCLPTEKVACITTSAHPKTACLSVTLPDEGSPERHSSAAQLLVNPVSVLSAVATA